MPQPSFTPHPQWLTLRCNSTFSLIGRIIIRSIAEVRGVEDLVPGLTGLLPTAVGGVENVQCDQCTLQTVAEERHSLIIGLGKLGARQHRMVDGG